MLIIQADPFNRSRIKTVIVAVISKNTALAAAPGNVLLAACASGLPLDSVVNVSQIITLDRVLMTDVIPTCKADKFDGKAQWALDETGLKIQLPNEKPCDHANALKITGVQLT